MKKSAIASRAGGLLELKGPAVKVFELIAHLQQMDQQAEVFHQWYEMNESGTVWDTGDVVGSVEQFDGSYPHRRRHGAEARYVVLK